MQDLICIKCDNAIRLYSQDESIKCGKCGKCGECGAYYVSRLGSNQTVQVSASNEIEIEYEFVEFRCIQSDYFKLCSNVCPAPYMFCQEHTDDKNVDSAIRDVQYNEKRLQTSKDKLEKIYESKKIWLIGKLSGVDESR